MAHCPKIANSIRSAPAQCLSAALCYVGQPQSFFYPCNKLLFFKGLLHGVFSCHFIANIPFHKMRLFVPKWLKSKLPAIAQKIFARASNLLHYPRLKWRFFDSRLPATAVFVFSAATTGARAITGMFSYNGQM